MRRLSADGWSARDACVIFVTLGVGAPSQRAAQNAHEIAEIRQDLTCRVTLVKWSHRDDGHHVRHPEVRRETAELATGRDLHKAGAAIRGELQTLGTFTALSKWIA